MKKGIIILLFAACSLTAWRDATPEEYAFVRRIVHEGDIVFDIGANLGFKSEQYLAAGGKVYGAEPLMDCYRYLKIRFEKNENAHFLHAGVGDKPGILQISSPEKALAFATFSEEWKEKSRWNHLVWDQHELVAMVTLDHMIERFGLPKYCKIDVENYEPEVLAGLSQVIPVLSFEYHFETVHNFIKCIRRLEEIGYKEFNLIVGEHADFALNNWVSGDTIIKMVYTLARPEYSGIQLWGDAFARRSQEDIDDSTPMLGQE